MTMMIFVALECIYVYYIFCLFLAYRTNRRAYATMARQSVVCLSVVCNVCTCIVATRWILPKICPKKQIGNGQWGIEWSREP